MNIKYNLDELKEIMWSFYTVSGMRFILFDAECNKILSCPENDCEFCTAMRKYPVTARKCSISDRKSLKKCLECEGPLIYKCHAGLIEAALALHQNDTVVGYLMFGQITDNNNTDEVHDMLCRYCSDYGICDDEISESAYSIKYIDKARIPAAAKIMEACTSYILFKELITPQNSKIMAQAKSYIEDNLQNDISIYDICTHLQISRTKLYEVFLHESSVGVSEYIRKRRMHRAKKLLKETKLPIWEISHRVGYTDYTYFSHVFKKTYGVSPRECRNNK